MIFTCHRKDCVDRKFRAIRTAPRGGSQGRLISPSKVDIILKENDKDPRKEPGIHSFKKLASRASAEKDMLKEFREL